MRAGATGQEGLLPFRRVKPEVGCSLPEEHFEPKTNPQEGRENLRGSLYLTPTTPYFNTAIYFPYLANTGDTTVSGQSLCWDPLGV